MDLKHQIEHEKNKPENRRKRLQENLPLCYPLTMAVELSSDCNSNCYMCPRKNLSRNNGIMSFELFKKIVDELADNKIILRKVFLYWMGEPLMNDNFAKMITYAREKNIAEMIVMASNLIALDEKKARQLIDSQLDELFVSLDAVRSETYAKIRGNAASLKEVEKNLLLLVKMKKEIKASLPYIRLKILKSDLNRDEISEFRRKWEKVVDEIYVEEDINTWNGTNQDVNQNIETDAQYMENVKNTEHRWPCDRLWYQLAVSHDGFVTPCIADWNGLGFIANVKDKTIFEIWNSPELVEMRRRHLDGEYDKLLMCKDCHRWIFRHMEDWLVRNRHKALAVCKK